MSPRAKENAPPLECCREWMTLAVTQRSEWPWQVMHRFAHSRTTFSLATLAEIAKIPDECASGLIHSAEARKWIWTPQKDIWVGRLPRRR